MPNTLAARLNAVLTQRTMSQAELARLSGVKQQTVNYLCNPANPGHTSRYMTQIARALGINPVWLATGEGSPLDATFDVVAPDGTSMSAACVFLIPREELAKALSKKQFVPRATLTTDVKLAGEAFATEVDGDAMLPAFKPSDRVIIDTGVKPRPGDIVLAEYGDEYVLRKYRQIREGFELHAANEDFPPVRSGDRPKLIGVMVEHRSYRPAR